MMMLIEIIKKTHTQTSTQANIYLYKIEDARTKFKTGLEMRRKSLGLDFRLEFLLFYRAASEIQ